MSEYLDYLRELFRQLGPIRTRRMFGGYGVYSGEAMFALVLDDTLYLKSDAETEALFERERLPRFCYQKGEKTVCTSFFQAPADVLDDPDAARLWGERAYAAALRAKTEP